MTDDDNFTNSELMGYLHEARALFGIFFTRLECSDENGEICDAFEECMNTVIDALHDKSCCLKHFRIGGNCEVELITTELKQKLADEKKNNKRLIDKFVKEKEELIYQASKIHEGQTVLDKVKP